MYSRLTLVVCAALTTTSCNAADYKSCTTIKSATARLACFDKVAATESSGANDAAAERAAILSAIDSAKTSIADRFKDPGAVQFRNVVAYGKNKPLEISIICGQVNGKNSYGAYVGFRRFVSNGGASVEVEDNENARSIERMWSNTCTGNEVYSQ